MTLTQPDAALPVLAVVLDTPGLEFFPLTYVEAAAGVCRPLWVTLREDAETQRYLRILRRSGETVSVAGLTLDDAADAIRPYRPAGVIAFNEANVPWTASLAARLGLPYHSPRTAAQLADKFEQRSALRAHGLLTPGFWDIAELRADPELLDRVVASATFPLVLKPRVARASSDMARIADAARLREAVATTWPSPMLVEEFIPDPSRPLTGHDNADYVSVEALVSHGEVSILGASGRHPLVEPFREAGLFFPAEVAPELDEALAGTATAALHALDIDSGAFHVEIKTTDVGPVVIEINPRPGGSGLPTMLRRAFGIDIFREAMRVAIGEQIGWSRLARPSEIGFTVYVLPPDGLTHVTAVEGLEALPSIEGVESVVAKRGPGDDIDPHGGMLEYIVQVSGTVADHDTRRRTRQRILSAVIVR